MTGQALTGEPEVATAPVTARLLDGFDDPSFGPAAWNLLLHQGDTDVVYLTWHWQRSWWETLGRGRLLLVAAERAGRVVAVAPFYADSGMIFLVGSGVSDYMDFIGDIGDPDVLDALLQVARAEVPRFVGFRLYCVLETSRTAARLQAAGGRLGLECYEEKRWPAPVIDIADDPERVRVSASRRRVLKRERYFQRRGALTLRRFHDRNAILPHLEAFFEQHISQWAMADTKSPFLERPRRAFYEHLTRTAAESGWMRFSLLDWEGRPIAFEYGCQYEGTYYGGPSSFAVDLARHSPWQVLLRQLLLTSVDDGVGTYDLGVGDDPHKFLFATGLRHVCTWGLYPTKFLQALSAE